ncbi:RNA polymerase sigma factor [Pseudenhygromyxa sp. WMMC2535]|uniref:RNA polymerase sigma factor n=1 Tax=Pseudenhygromyxa sp. WMMC2535 TaxID=2712867 RepID=UPI001596249E|nr:RNA polymerase sigma factor [Pseudenhygromyxa sp. WMMC2535]NVB36555.1 RNA polymerase sigma factor [Pseudenhygromyxa sp. WMMC2535]
MPTTPMTTAASVAQVPVRADEREDAQRERLARCYRDHGPRLARQIVAITGNPSCVEDLVNETFIRAHEHFDRFEDRSALSTWLHGIAINVARAHVAKRSRRRRLDAALPEPARQGEDVEDAVRGREAVRRLYLALDQLDADLRVAFVLCVLEQRSLKEGSALLGVPVSTLHARRQRAEAFVRAQIEGEGEP